MSSPKVKTPQPSSQELANLDAQTKLLQQQSDLIQSQFNTQNLLAPYLYKQVGITPQYGAGGEITGFSEMAQTPEQQQAKQIENLSQQRTLLALQGKLPIDSSTMNQLNSTEKYLGESLAKQLGPGWLTSTPGQQAMAQWQQTKQGIIDAASRGDITTSEGVALSQGSENARRQADFLAQAAGMTNLSNPALLGQAAQGYNSPLQFWQNQQQMDYQSRIMNTQPALWARIFGGLGNMVTAVPTAAWNKLLS